MAAKAPSWEERAKRFLKAELARADIGYRELAERLKKHGMKEIRGQYRQQDQPRNVLGDIPIGITQGN